MKITLIETGGLIGKTKKAETTIDLSGKKYNALLEKISIEQKRDLQSAKDAFSYFLLKEGEDKPTPISISNIPIEYNDMFDRLFSGLEIVRK